MQRKYKTTIIILLVTSATMQIIRQYQRNDMIAGPLIEKLPLMTLFENIPLCITKKNLIYYLIFATSFSKAVVNSKVVGSEFILLLKVYNIRINFTFSVLSVPFVSLVSSLCC